jgi:hypothetical protein
MMILLEKQNTLKDMENNNAFPLSLVDERYFEPINETHSRVFGKCVITKQDWECVLPTEGIRRFQLGEHLHKCLGKEPAENREFLMSGISPMGWAKLFPEGEE